MGRITTVDSTGQVVAVGMRAGSPGHGVVTIIWPIADFALPGPGYQLRVTAFRRQSSSFATPGNRSPPSSPSPA